MKAFFFTFLLTAISFASFGQAHTTHNPFKNDLQRQKIKGKAVTITENEYNSLGDSLKLRSVSKFDDNGNIISFLTYSPSGSVLSKTTFKYNDSNKIVEELRYKA